MLFGTLKRYSYNTLKPPHFRFIFQHLKIQFLDENISPNDYPFFYVFLIKLHEK